MNQNIPNIIFPIIALTIATGIALYSWRRSRTVAIVAMGWAILSLFTARIPFFQTLDRWSDGDFLGFLAFNAVFATPLLLLLIGLRRSATFQKFMEDTPTWVLTATQIYRLTGTSFLILYVQGLLPAAIGLSNGLQDFIIGITALPLAWMLYRGFFWSRNWAIVWNLAGLFDLVSAVTVITLSISGLIELVPAPSRMGIYPLSLISLYQVVIAMFIHIYLLRRLLGSNMTASVQASK